jgi:hypothetical protein
VRFGLLSAPLILALALTALFCSAAAWKVWPVIDGDGPAYFPPAVEWSLGRPLTNPLWLPPLDDSIDGPGGRRYIYHGFLYQMIVGTTGRWLGGGPEATVRAAYVVHWLAALVAALAILSWAQLKGSIGLAAALLLPMAMLGLSVAWHGRMEPFAILLVAAVSLGWYWLEGSWLREATAGAGTALLFFTSPACGVVGGCLLLSAIIASQDPAAPISFSRKLATTTAGFCLATIAAVWVFPYPIFDWVEGVRRHGRIHLGLAIGQGFVDTWLTRPELPLLAASLALLAVAATPNFWALGRVLPRPRRIAFGVFVVLFFAGLTVIAFLKTEASYNAVVYMPLLASAGVARRPCGSRSWRSYAVLVALLFPAAGLFRSSVILAGRFGSHAVGFREVRETIQQLTPLGCEITSGLWMAADDVTRVTIRNGSSPEQRFVIRQQTYTGRADPPEFPGYTLVENRYGRGLNVLGLPLTRTPGGWEFAVYERRINNAKDDGR